MFLKSWRTTIVAAAVIPLAVLIAIVFMKFFNMSFNLMTLGGLAACIGVVIDDAIVMVENIIVHLSTGQAPMEAAKSAITELAPALTGSTLTPIMVFAPLVFLGGITGVFFRALAMTMVTALLASLFLAIFFTPVLAAIFFRRSGGDAATDLEQAEQAGEGRVLRWLTSRYEAALHWSLHHPRLILLTTVVVLAGMIGVYFQLGSGFLPEMDEGAFVLDYRMPAGTSLQETDRVLRHIEQFIRRRRKSRATHAALARVSPSPLPSPIPGTSHQAKEGPQAWFGGGHF